jgi:hypothetical protein
LFGGSKTRGDDDDGGSNNDTVISNWNVAATAANTYCTGKPLWGTYKPTDRER